MQKSDNEPSDNEPSNNEPSDNEIFEIYLIIKYDNSDWDEQLIILNKDDAISYSLKHKDARIEIFQKSEDNNTFIPTYSYYRDGILYENI